jgi:hypothetical protein
MFGASYDLFIFNKKTIELEIIKKQRLFPHMSL